MNAWRSSACRRLAILRVPRRRKKIATMPPPGGPEGAFSGVPGMFDDSWVKVPVQPGGGEGLAKRKGEPARGRLKEAWSKAATRRTGTGYEAVWSGRVGKRPRSPYPPRGHDVNPAGVLRRSYELTLGGLRHCPPGWTEEIERFPDRGAEVSRRHSRWWKRAEWKMTRRPHPAEGPNDETDE